MAKTATAVYFSVAVLLTACGGGPETPSHQSLTLRASVNKGVVRDVSPPHYVLQMPNAGDAAIVTLYEGSRQVPFSLGSGTCAGMVNIAPGSTAMEQKVTDIRWGVDCTATVNAADGNTSTLEIFALPPP